MKPTNMPLSPASSHSGELLQHGLHHIAQHNASSPYPSEVYQYDEGVHLNSNRGSPTPGYEDLYSYRGGPPKRLPYQQHQHQDSGLGIDYENFSPDYQSSVYQDYSTPGTSPTPSMHQELMRTRSGYTIPRTHQGFKPMPDIIIRSDRSPKPKKSKKDKVAAEKKVAKLEKPISELTRDWTHVPVIDIEAYVNRSAGERRKEVAEGKIPGKIKRPMNSFMLYRKAYQNRTKSWCLQNNHQVVSQVCGDSWPLEPAEVREQFTEWAKIERQNHQEAHPGYKFSPTKPAKVKSDKRTLSPDLESEESDLDDFEWGGGPSRKPKRARPSPRPQAQHPVAYPSTRSAYHYSSRENSLEPLYNGYDKSSFLATNPGRPMPQPYNQGGLSGGEYYETRIHNHPHFEGVQDVVLRKTVAPVMHSILGVPGGGQQYDMMNQYHQLQYEQHPQMITHRIDPSLMPRGEQIYHHGLKYPESHPDGDYGGGGNQSDIQWQQPPYTLEQIPQGGEPEQAVHFVDPELDVGLQIQDQHAHILKGHQEGWHVESLDAGEGAFDKWMDEET